MQGLDDEAVGAQHAHPVAVAGVELDATARPLHPADLRWRPAQPLVGVPLVLGDAQGDEHAVGQEDEPPTRPQQPRRLGHPPLGVAPDAGAVLADDQVEGGVRQRHVLAAGFDEREGHAERLLAAAGRLELGRRQVDTDRSRAGAGQPGREVRRAAAELDHVEPGHIPRAPHVALGDLEQSPGDLLGRPGSFGVGVGEGRIDLRPHRPVELQVFLHAVTLDGSGSPDL